MATTNKFTLKQGFAGDINFTIRNADGTALNLTSATDITLEMKYKKADTSSVISKSLSSGISVTTATSGLIACAFTQAETIALTKSLKGELTIKFSSSSIVKTVDIFITVEKAVYATAV